MNIIIKTEDLLAITEKKESVLAECLGPKDTLYLVSKDETAMVPFSALLALRNLKTPIVLTPMMIDFGVTATFLCGKLSQQYASASEKQTVLFFAKEDSEKEDLNALKALLSGEKLNLQIISSVSGFAKIEAPQKVVRAKRTARKVTSVPKEGFPDKTSQEQPAQELESKFDVKMKSYQKKFTAAGIPDEILNDKDYIKNLKTAIQNASDAVIGLEIQLQIRFGEEMAKKITGVLQDDFQVLKKLAQ